MKVFGVIGWKNAGKTGLMERLVTEITGRGLSVSTIKHVHHDVDLDQPGKDTFRHRAAGAREVVLASSRRHAILTEHRDGPEPELPAILARLAPVDLVLVEGYKRDSHPKIEVFRTETGQSLIQPGDPLIRAVATDAALPALPVPVLDLNDTAAIADFILVQTGLRRDPRAVFDTVIVVDWSAASTRSPEKGSADAIWVGIAREGGEETLYCRSRAEAETALGRLFDGEAAAGRRVLAGFDFPLGYPEGFAPRLTGETTARAVWHWLAAHLTDGPDNRNNRFDVADAINARMGGPGPFWGRPAALPRPHLPATKAVDYPALGMSEFRKVEAEAQGAKSVWQLNGAGCVGGQTLTGLPLIARLSMRRGAAVWPFDPVDAAVVLAEVYPSLLADAVTAAMREDDTLKPVKDQIQVRLLARALFRLSRTGAISALMADIPRWPGLSEEGWILGAGHHVPALKAVLEWP